MTKGPGLPRMEGLPGLIGPLPRSHLSLHRVANAGLRVSAALLKMTHTCRAPSLFCLLLPPSLPSSFQRPLQVPLAYYIPACMSLSPRSHLWPPPGRNSSPNLYTVQKSRMQGLRPDSPGSHPGSCTPRGMTAVPRLSHAQQHSGSFIRFLGG